MIPFAIPLALKALPWRIIGIAAGAIAVALAVWWLVDAIGDAREEKVRAEYEEAKRAAEARAAADTAALHQAFAEIDADVAVNMEAIENVRTIYRDKVRTVAVEVYRDRGCDLPRSLLSEINAAAGDYARAASGSGAAVPAPRPAP